MEHPTHECEENLNRLTIYYTGENWATTYWWITFCPFCGLKLERPRVDVYCNVMKSWVDTLYYVNRHVTGKPSGQLLLVIDSIKRAIEEPLSDCKHIDAPRYRAV